MKQFKFVGDAVVLDYLKDIGILDVIKPDVHVLRVFFRLGFIASEDSFNEAIKVAEAFKQATSEKLIVIDAVFWMYGGGGDGHVKKAICNKNNPFYNECHLTIYCEYYKGLLH
jgi:endonuclease III